MCISIYIHIIIYHYIYIYIYTYTYDLSMGDVLLFLRHLAPRLASVRSRKRHRCDALSFTSSRGTRVYSVSSRPCPETYSWRLDFSVWWCGSPTATKTYEPPPPPAPNQKQVSSRWFPLKPPPPPPHPTKKSTPMHMPPKDKQHTYAYVDFCAAHAECSFPLFGAFPPGLGPLAHGRPQPPQVHEAPAGALLTQRGNREIGARSHHSFGSKGFSCCSLA